MPMTNHVVELIATVIPKGATEIGTMLMSYSGKKTKPLTKRTGKKDQR